MPNQLKRTSNIAKHEVSELRNETRLLKGKTVILKTYNIAGSGKKAIVIARNMEVS